MPSYIPIADTEIDPESPITTSLATRWRDNPLAIAEGDVAAPRIQHAGLAADAGDYILLATFSVTSNTSTIDINNLDTTKYYDFTLVFNNLGSSLNSATNFSTRLSINNGSSYITTNYISRYLRGLTATVSTGNLGTGSYDLNNGNSVSGVGTWRSGFIQVLTTKQAAGYTNFRGQIYVEGEAPGANNSDRIEISGGHCYGTTTIPNGLRFYFTTSAGNGTASAGVISNGQFAFYARRRT